MSDPPGVPSALGIEAVECFSEGTSLTVRVTGRWRRRRPDFRGQAMLVVEAQGTRHRFQAMPEPPSLVGTLPGTWRMSFSVPAELGRFLGERTWLQLGAVVVPLPVTVETQPPVRTPADTETSADTETPAAPEVGGSGMTIEAARRRALEAEAAAAELALRVSALERDLEDARVEPDQLRAMLAGRERERRIAEQRVHAERARRVEAEEELADGGGAHEFSEEAQALELRVGELERELERVRRQADEAEHLAAAANAARARAERELLEHTPETDAERPPPRAERISPMLRAERLLAKGASETSLSADASARVARRRADGPSGTPAAAVVERELIEAHATPSRESQLEAVVTERSAELDTLRVQLARARELAERERSIRSHAERRALRLERELIQLRSRAARAYEAIEEIRGQLRALAPAPPPPPVAPDPAGAVEAERLSTALARLRESTPPAESPPAGGEERQSQGEGRAPEEPTGPRKAWLYRIFRTLVKQDPMTAGRLLLALLPAQREVQAQPLAYDLILGELACVQVTVGNRSVDVEFGDEPRPAEQVHFRVRGDLPSIARLLVAGRMRRRLGRRHASVEGERSRFAALKKLVRSSLTLRELHTAGVRLDPELALTVAALMIDPAWTAGERFTIAHQGTGSPSPSAYMHVRDGSPPRVFGEHPRGELSTTIVCSPDALLPLLSGDQPPDVFVRGEPHHLQRLQQWLARAQSG